MPYGVVKERKDHLAVVIMQRQEMCGECHACEMISGKKECSLTCEVHAECEVGDKVEVELGTSHFLKATYIMYGIPLLGFIGGLLISLVLVNLFKLQNGDGWLIAGMLGGTLLGAAYIKGRDTKNVYKKYLPYITGKVEE